MATIHKRIFILSLFCCGILCVTAQKNMIFKFKSEILGGITTKEKGNCFGLETALELPLYGDHNWEYTYNFPTAGFALGVLYLTDPDYISPVIYSNPYFNYPLIHKPGFSFNIKLGAGIATYTQTGDSTSGYIFPVTGLLTGGLNADIALGKLYGNPYSQWSITIGANGILFNNGNITKKAKNLAIINAAIGLKYTPNVNPLPIKNKAKSVKRILALEICGQGGVNQLSREDKNHYYPNASLNVGFYLPITNAYRLGLGAEAFYNEIYNGTQRSENRRYNFIKEDDIRNKLRAGLFLANDLTIDRFVAGIHVGGYVFSKIIIPEFDDFGNKNKNRIENFLYTKLVMKYKITKNFMVNMQFKSHLLEMECFEMGFGYAMPDFGSRVKNPFSRISLKKEDKKELKID